jgi:hypothetical protein
MCHVPRRAACQSEKHRTTEPLSVAALVIFNIRAFPEMSVVSGSLPNATTLLERKKRPLGCEQAQRDSDAEHSSIQRPAREAWRYRKRA